MPITERLVNRYGKEILKDFEVVRKDYNFNLKNIAEKYNFSREYARQLFKSIYGMPYTITLHKKSELRVKEKRQDLTDPIKRVERITGENNQSKSAQTKLFIYNLLKEKELKIEVADANGKYDFIVNRKRIGVASCFIGRKTNEKYKSRYFHFKINHKRNHINTAIVYVAPRKEIYIIPASELPLSGEIFIRDRFSKTNAHNCKDRYLPYLNNWREVYKQIEVERR